MSAATDSGGPPPQAQLIQMGTAFWGLEMLLFAAQFGIAYRLAAGAKASSELAAGLGAARSLLSSRAAARSAASRRTLRVSAPPTSH